MRHLAWGPQVDFTYGPLGFLATLPYYSFEQSLLASLYQPAVVASLLLGIASALRERIAPLLSLLGALLTTSIVVLLNINGYTDWSLLAAFSWAAVLLLRRDPKHATVLITCTCLGAVAGLQFLVKLNTGLAILLVALAASILVDLKAVGRHCATVIAFTASMLLCWLLAGQQLSDLPSWLKASAAFVSGYSEAMSIPLDQWDSSWAFFWVFVALGAAWICALVGLFLRGGAEIPRRFVVLVALVTAITAQAALGRLSIGKSFILVNLIVVATAMIPLSRIHRRAFVGAVAAAVALEIGLESSFLGAFPDYRMQMAWEAPEQAIDRLAVMASSARQFDQRIEATKARQRALYRVPDQFVEAIGSETVHVDPSDTSAVWAYDFAWHPAPVFQSYAAYTPSLDELNSESMSKGPKFVLSRRVGIDNRVNVQESPRYSISLLCNYVPNGVANQWTLFERSDLPHCGALNPISEVTVKGDDVIEVPAPSGPDMAVLVAIDLKPTIMDRLFEGRVLPLYTTTLNLNGISHRLLTANAAVPFLVNSPVSVDGTTLQIHAHTIGLGHNPSLGQSGVTARLRFYELHVES